MQFLSVGGRAMAVGGASIFCLAENAVNKSSSVLHTETSVRDAKNNYLLT